MHLIEVTHSPCTVCGRGNTPNGDDHEPPLFVDLERDVNWNDPVILCEECAVKVGSLIGMLTPDDKKDMDRTVEKLKKEIHKLKAEMDAVKRRANKAIRRARATEVLS